MAKQISQSGLNSTQQSMFMVAENSDDKKWTKEGENSIDNVK